MRFYIVEYHYACAFEEEKKVDGKLYHVNVSTCNNNKKKTENKLL